MRPCASSLAKPTELQVAGRQLPGEGEPARARPKSHLGLVHRIAAGAEQEEEAGREKAYPSGHEEDIGRHVEVIGQAQVRGFAPAFEVARDLGGQAERGHPAPGASR